MSENQEKAPAGNAVTPQAARAVLAQERQQRLEAARDRFQIAKAEVERDFRVSIYPAPRLTPDGRLEADFVIADADA